MVGRRVDQPEQPIVERALREGRIWAQDDPVLVDGIPLRMDAVPVRYKDRVIAVITKEGSPGTSRRPGRLEQVYLEAADHVSEMICRGHFPYPDTPTGDWPRIGDGLFVLDDFGCITWASPNALSSLRRLGVQQNVLDRWLDELGVGDTPVRAALSERRVLDGELSRGDTHVRLRVLPLFEGDRRLGGLVLSRDVTELRARDRMLSVKDATIREIHHRVKNNLQTVASLLRLQARSGDGVDPRKALDDSANRILTIAAVHEVLTETRHDDVELAELLDRLRAMLVQGLGSPKRIDAELEQISLAGHQATALALVFSELLQNALEHGGETIRVELTRRNGQVVLAITDDGAGVDDDPTGTGLSIVGALVRDELRGTLELHSNGGLRVEVAFPA
jgi:two-component system, sensor histidine kinase PdtaS